MITQVKVGQKYINASVAITNDEGVAFDPTSAEVWFYKISQINGAITLDTNINGTGKVPLSKQDGQTGFYGTSIDIASFLETEYVVLFKVTAAFAETITVEYLSIDSTKYQISDIWNYSNRTLTSLGTLVSDIAVAVWTYITRTITAGGITAAEIWEYMTRTLTAGTKDSEINAIKERTDNLPDDPTSETNATINKEEIINSIPDYEDLLKRILGLSQENYRITSTTYVGSLLTAATIKIYPTKADCEADINAIAIYNMIASFDVDGNCIDYRITKE